ncbi:MAG: HD domain-containing protein [Candidatus Micrarchaeota archaeon]|nr:HD domain-containing protein [Candidatus Micrarchaeota archaeon]
MIRIRDPLHGSIALNEIEERVLDSAPMQRLRGIRQLAMAYLVYPGANHTRFEHSLGTMHLADRICVELEVGREEAAKVRLAALLHDVGHIAFSHESEQVLSPILGTHEQIGERMIKESEISEIISEQFSPSEIASLHRKPLGEAISSDIGADRMDYLLRDSHYTGVAYGVIDADRICSSLAFSKKGLALTERGLVAAESLLVARFTMFSAVYLHKTVRIANRMLQQSIKLAIEDRTLDPKLAVGMSDAQMLELLCSSPLGGAFAQRLKQRRLYKKAFSIPLSKLALDEEEAEQEISEKAGCGALLDVPKLSTAARIMLEQEGGRSAPLQKKSELVASLQRMQKDRLEAIVICDQKDLKKVRSASKKVLG